MLICMVKRVKLLSLIFVLRRASLDDPTLDGEKGRRARQHVTNMGNDSGKIDISR